MKETFISHQTLWKGRAKPKDYSELKKRKCKNSKSAILRGPQNGGKIAHVRARTSIRNSLFARRNFSHCKQNKEWTKMKRLSTEEKKRHWV